MTPIPAIASAQSASQRRHFMYNVPAMKNPIRALGRRLAGRTAETDFPLLVFREFENSLNLIEDYDHIAGNFLGRIKEVCRVPKLLLLIHDADAGRFAPSASAGLTDDEERAVFLPRNSRLVKWLKVNETFLEIRKQQGVLEYLTRKETETLASLGIEFCFPLQSMNRLIGILLVGAKEDGKPLTKDDVAFVSSLILFKEQRERFRRMSRADRLATIGELAAGAAHEIRNPLTAIKSSLQYLRSKHEDETSQKLLAAAIEETGRIDEIVSALLSFSRPTEIKRERHDLREVLEESLDLVAFQARKAKVAVRRQFPDAPLAIQGDKSQLKQLFLNIFLNAIQAMPARRTRRKPRSLWPTRARAFPRRTWTASSTRSSRRRRAGRGSACRSSTTSSSPTGATSRSGASPARGRRS
jgi:signal transduction histidine kinase